MIFRWLVCAIVGAMAVPAAADTRPDIPMNAFRDAAAKSALDRLERSTDRFKSTVDATLDDSVLNGTSLEDRLNQWANLLEDEIDTAQKEFNRVAGSGAHPDTKALERFGDHWGNALMAATAINRAMIRRGFAPEAERQWIDIRTDLNRVAKTLGSAPLPDMTVVIFRPAPYSVLSKAEVKQIMEQLQKSSDRFEDKLEHAWFVAMGPEQQRVAERWSDELKGATKSMLDEYGDRNAREFQFKLEEVLMLAAGLNRAILAGATSPASTIEWNALRSDLNTLATTFGYPVLAGTPRA